MDRRAALGIVASAVVTLLATAPAHAAVVSLENLGAPYVTVVDRAQQPDDLQIGVAADGTTVVVTGATAHAGPGCRQDSATVVSCPGTSLPGLTVELNGGDDRLVVDGRFNEPTLESFDGGDGADSITAQGTLRGGPGNDVLRIGRPSDLDVLDGGEGDDELFAAGGPATLVGGPGHDVLHGGPAGDALIDYGDEGSHDAIACGGGPDIVERDRGDTTQGCASTSADGLALMRFVWRVWGGRYTEPYRLFFTMPAVGQSADFGYMVAQWKAVCRGKPCHGARFRARDVGGAQARIRFTIKRGGVKVPGRRIRAVLPGARITLSYRIELAGITFTKVARFTTRAGRFPAVRKSCFARLPGGPNRRAPCL